MNTIKVHQLADEERNVIRGVALAYRRAWRAGVYEHGCYEAALAEYWRLVPDTTADKVEVSRHVCRIIAAAIGADTKWFWDGPDA